MPLRFTRLALLLMLCTGSGLAVSAEAADPYATDDALPLKPALRLAGAASDPCAFPLPERALELPEVINLALCNNPQTREVWANSRVQAAQVGVSQARYLPQLALDASARHNIPGGKQYSAGLTLSYLLYDFGARAANLENARQLLAAASATQDSTVQAVFLAAVQAFYQVQASQTALDAAIEAEHAAQRSAAAAEARYLAGSATPADKLQAKTAWSQAQLNRISAEGGQHKAAGGLANILGLDADRSVALVPASSEPVPTDFEQAVSALIDEARQRRPDLRAAEAQLKAARSNADAVRATDRPNISLSASTSRDYNAGNSSQNSALGIYLNVPLFSGYAPTYRIRAAEAQIETRQAQLERVRLQIALDVWNTYHNLLTATQLLHSSADLLNSAQQSARVALGRYEAGVGTMLEVLNAQSALAQARRQRIQSVFDWNISRATLAQAMGNLDENLLQTLAPDASVKEQP